VTSMNIFEVVRDVFNNLIFVLLTIPESVAPIASAKEPLRVIFLD
jgi:hypothetical protein